MQDLGHRERVHPVWEVAPHQAFAAATVGVHAAAARHDDPDPVLVGAEEPLQELLPSRVLVQLVEQHRGEPLPQPFQPESLGQRLGTPEDHLAVIDVVPVRVGAGVVPARRGLAHLARPADEGHLPPARQVVREQGIVGSPPRLHADHYR